LDHKTLPPPPASPTANNSSIQPESFPDQGGEPFVSGVSIRGEVRFGSELIIDGEVEGNITSDDD
jgi:cytoskeletal protein CcmA (bactofilin family)